jgi:hypothetical protein
MHQRVVEKRKGVGEHKAGLATVLLSGKWFGLQQATKQILRLNTIAMQQQVPS